MPRDDAYEEIVEHANLMIAALLLERENADIFDQCALTDAMEHPELDDSLRALVAGYRLHLFAKRLAAGILVFLSAATTLAVSVNAFGLRDKLYQLIIRDHADHYSLRLEKTDNLVPVDRETLALLAEKKFPYAPGRLPPGYALDLNADWGEYGALHVATYKHVDDEGSFNFTVSALDLDKELDSESGQVSPVLINGYEGTLNIHRDKCVLIWYIDEYFLELDGQIDRDTIVEIAKNVIPL